MTKTSKQSKQTTKPKKKVREWRAWAVEYNGDICRSVSDFGPPIMFAEKDDALEFGWKGCRVIKVKITEVGGRRKGR